MLTEKQRILFDVIEKSLSETGVSPSFEELKDALGLKSKSGIHRLVKSLEDRGFIRRLPHKARAMEILRRPEELKTMPEAPAVPEDSSDPAVTEIPLFGKIAAGVPIEAIRDEAERIPIPAGMLGRGRHYALTVDGDSMMEGGILDGDTALIAETQTAENGAIVVALVDGEDVTLKRLLKKDGMVHLIPENSAYETRILPPDRVHIQGRLIGLLRQY